METKGLVELCQEKLAYESIVVESINCHVHVGFPFWTYACKTEVRVMPAAGGLRADSLRGHRRHIRLFFLLNVRFYSHWSLSV